MNVIEAGQPLDSKLRGDMKGLSAIADSGDLDAKVRRVTVSLVEGDDRANAEANDKLDTLTVEIPGGVRGEDVRIDLSVTVTPAANLVYSAKYYTRKRE